MELDLLFDVHLACKQDMTSRLFSLGIRGKRGRGEEEVSESELILNRAGHIGILRDEEKEAPTICPKHKKPLTADWPGRTNYICCYPAHQGIKRWLSLARSVYNAKMSADLFVEFSGRWVKTSLTFSQFSHTHVLFGLWDVWYVRLIALFIHVFSYSSFWRHVMLNKSKQHKTMDWWFTNIIRGTKHVCQWNKKCQYNKARLITFMLIKNQAYFQVVCARALLSLRITVRLI